MANDAEELCMCLFAMCISSLDEGNCPNLLPIKKIWLFCFLNWFLRFLSIIWMQIFYQVCDLKFSSVQSLSRVRLFVTPWIAARQASLSITNSRSSPKLMCIESVMPSSHLILCRPPSPPALNPSQHQGLFQWVNSSHEVAKVLEFQPQHQSFQWTPTAGLI